MFCDLIMKLHAPVPDHTLTIRTMEIGLLKENFILQGIVLPSEYHQCLWSIFSMLTKIALVSQCSGCSLYKWVKLPSKIKHRDSEKSVTFSA